MCRQLQRCCLVRSYLVSVLCAADASRFPNLAMAAALSIEVIQEAKETIFVPRFAQKVLPMLSY